ncbi:NAD-dependent epimerase/dehydratase family protein [Salinarimonas ramus]|uniref:Epimerase n=1 Tax=Salinarimonas ramus TaxID=690164 RepID=A0A917Q487_9HYPH|nr:NAD-dependent epimerase/dehydratase family protein [Salinarimonas ramus]GGK20295.1 epimerase [Salinarimonas ramus]
MSAPLVALTGTTGFVGRALAADLRAHGYRVRALLRRPSDEAAAADSAVIGDLARPVNMARALEDVDVVVHSAGIAHAMSGRPDDDYRAINTDATIALARAAERAGGRRFLFLSSVRAQTGPSAAGIVSETTPPAPTDAYGRSKLAAEEGLAALAIDWAALRPVLVYGPGVKGNMASLLRLARSPWPIPVPIPSGRRSLLAVENLGEAVRTLITAEGTLRQPCLVADDDALDVAAILRALRRGAGRGMPNLPVPAPLFRALARAAGRGEVAERLSGDLVVDTSRLKALGYAPVVTTEAALARLAREATSE